jgi:hypothetical protein
LVRLAKSSVGWIGSFPLSISFHYISSGGQTIGCWWAQFRDVVSPFHHHHHHQTISIYCTLHVESYHIGIAFDMHQEGFQMKSRPETLVFCDVFTPSHPVDYCVTLDLYSRGNQFKSQLGLWSHTDWLSSNSLDECQSNA